MLSISDLFHLLHKILSEPDGPLNHLTSSLHVKAFFFSFFLIYLNLFYTDKFQLINYNIKQYNTTLSSPLNKSFGYNIRLWNQHNSAKILRKRKKSQTSTIIKM